MLHRVLPFVRALALAVLGAGVGLSCVAVHGLGWGLPLGLVTTVALLLAVPPGWSWRFAVVVGWVTPVAVLASVRPEGDYLIASDVRGYVLLVFAAVVLALGVAGLRGRRREAAPAAASTAAEDDGTAP